ncbi:MAG: beta-galactosidase [Anaerolineae bacterium]|nr:beta-galactosidase [Anaerolineae bacterium]
MQVPRPEYPRPQLRRERWLNLNGPWEFEYDPGLSGIERGLFQAEKLPKEILVPFCPESSLSGLADLDFHPGVWYRRTFTLPASWSGGRILLHFGAVDHDAFIWVNGQQAGEHHGGYTPFSFDITNLLHSGENIIVLHAQDDTRSPWVASGKQCPEYYSRGCHYTRTTGIWQTVWLEPVPSTYIQGLKLIPLLDQGQVLIELTLGGSISQGSISAHASLEGQPMGEIEVPFQGQKLQFMLPLNATILWSPEHPTLYDLKLELKANNGSHDLVQSYFGLRSLALSEKALLLNGAPLFQRLVLDQGFYPDGIYTAPTDEALRQDILISQAMGFNGARLHQKVFEPRFLYWADRLGYLVWGEFPSWGLDVSQPKALEIFLPQWLEALHRDLNHPALVGWCPFNETQADQDPEVIRTVYRVTKSLDPTRPVIDTSGYQHVETDIYDVHNYTQDVSTFRNLFAPLAQGGEPFRNRPELDAPYAGQPYFVSEYGGTWWNPGQKDDKAWGYGERPKTEAEFLERYRGLTEALLRHPRICAFCYTQLYDIEQEVNGLYTYNRQAKFDPALIRQVNTQKARIEE